MKKSILLSIFICSSLITFAQKDWANFERYEELNKKVMKTADAVFMGNSITDNWYGINPAFFDANNFIGRGISGQTTSEMLVRFRQDVINLNPKTVVILAGTNDIAQNNGYISLENIFGNIVSMAEIAKAHQIKVLLCSVLPVHQYPWRKEIAEPSEKIKKLNAMIKKYCDKNKYTYVDYYTVMVDEHGGLSEKLSIDGVHPNVVGYQIMQDIILKDLHKVLNK
jgi:lysophospholipase L1-like esterase